MKLLIINPGSTSTKIGLYEDETKLLEKVLRHEADELSRFGKITSQADFRRELVTKAVEETGIKLTELDAIVGRGGLLRPIKGGTYNINENMLHDLREGIQGEHASSLGGIIAWEIAELIGKPSFIVDPVVVDELSDVARVTGNPLFKKRSIFHALNQKAIARQYCKETGKNYEDVDLIVCHMGGGISAGLHKKGRVVDVNNALNGDGPFSPERSGTLPAGELVSVCFSGKYTQSEVEKMVVGKGGMVAHFGSSNMIELEERAKTDAQVKVVLDAMVYKIAKEIGAMAAAACGKVDAILLTGGICYSDYISGELERMVSFIADVKRYPGEDELSALAQGALRVLRGEEEALTY